MTTTTRPTAAEITASIRHDEAELAAARREVTLRIMGGNALDEQAVYRVGQRVRITAGGYSGEEGTVRAVNPGIGGYVYIVTLDTGMLFYDGGRRLEAESR